MLNSAIIYMILMLHCIEVARRRVRRDMLRPAARAMPCAQIDAAPRDRADFPPPRSAIHAQQPRRQRFAPLQFQQIAPDGQKGCAMHWVFAVNRSQAHELS